MIKHGEEFGDDSAFGISLVNMGRAHCKIATLQETFAMRFEDTYLSSITQMEDEIKEYQAQRKKLESRRLSYDAAISKLEKVKSSKKEKEKERKEAEDEWAKAKSRFEETSEDVRARMHAIQENEMVQLRELTAFLDLEMNFVEQYLEVLRDVKAGWIDEATMAQMEAARPQSPMHTFARTSVELNSSSARSNKSISLRSNHGESSGEEFAHEEPPRSRGLSLTRRKSEAGSKPPSRSQSRASRKRSGSTATVSSEKEREKDKMSRKMNVTGWASSAVSSVTGRSKKDKDKDNFAALRDEDESDEHGREDYGEPKRPSSALSSSSRISRHRSKSSTSLPKMPTRVPKSPHINPQGRSPRKVVVALHDFAAGSSDELTFRAGDQIVVLNEVLDEWWMGELGGRRGLFPTTYTEVISSSTELKPPLPLRPPLMLRGKGASAPAALSLDDMEGKHKPFSADVDDNDVSNSDDEHPFSDNYDAYDHSPVYGQFGNSGNMSSEGEDEEERLMPARRSFDNDDRIPSQPVERPIPVRRLTDLAPIVSPVKKPPPPPPPRRTTNNLLVASSAPRLPSRPATLLSKSSQSSSTSLAIAAQVAAREGGLTNSPFDSPGDEW
ncbi:hypothetical protein AcV5_010014 [Taiwanofungus camphoratus]|nr:hypothetical protein AcV5_010014 [Antrodia cinnamomea]